jgi:hypothetical protein
MIDNDLKIRVQYEWQQLKKQGYQNNKVYIKEIPPKGLGVFAKEDIKAGEVAEMCHTFTAEIPSKYVQDKNMSEYMLPGVINNEAHPSFAFGFGCIYNSSESEDSRNIEWTVIPESRLSVFIANRDIKKDEELLAWFGEGFYITRCQPHKHEELRKVFHKYIDDKLSLVKLPNNKNNILDDKLTKRLEINIVDDNNCDVKLAIQNLNDHNLNNIIREDCINYLKQINGMRNIEIIFI